MVSLHNYQMLQQQVQPMPVQHYLSMAKSPNADFSADVDTIGGADNENYTPLPLTETTTLEDLLISNLNGKTCTSTTDIVEVEVKVVQVDSFFLMEVM